MVLGPARTVLLDLCTGDDVLLCSCWSVRLPTVFSADVVSCSISSLLVLHGVPETILAKTNNLTYYVLYKHPIVYVKTLLLPSCEAST